GRDRSRFREYPAGIGRLQGVPEWNSRALHRAAAAGWRCHRRQLSHARRTIGTVSGRRMQSPPNTLVAVARIDALLAGMRPKLPRYCARMVGSAIDGEDVLQDAMIKAVEAFRLAGAIGNPEGWLFRIAHNTALDYLRRRKRQQALHSAEEVDMIADQLDA